MSDDRCYIAVDLGAESGRVMLGRLAGGTLTLSEAHRFPNGPVRRDTTLRWDFPQLMTEVRKGILLAARMAGGRVRGIGVNSWGVDFGLLDDEGRLIEWPYHYRDSRTDGMMERAFALMPKRDIFERTGLQFMQLNTLFQLLAMRLAGDPALHRARKLLFMANLVAHELGGRPVAEYTLASTSQMMDMRTGNWSAELLARLGLPAQILPEVVPPTAIIGTLKPDIAVEAACGHVPIIAAPSHDTAGAVAAVPSEGDRWAYLSSGTWSLMGLELPAPVVTDAAFTHNLTNEGGVEASIRLLKNIMGLWLVQECRRQWQREGVDLSYAKLTELAAAAPPFAARISLDHTPFLAPGDMPARINDYLKSTGQAPLTDKGSMVRTVLECLAFTYRRTLDALQEVSGRKVDTLHIVGGGTQNELLSQFAADATGIPVIAGPVEATSAGNVLIQAKATGALATMADLRAVVRASFPTRRFTPRHTADWTRRYADFAEL
jgi:rhamnulokinase